MGAAFSAPKPDSVFELYPVAEFRDDGIGIAVFIPFTSGRFGSPDR
jgi:hypothetical protein